MYELVPVPTTWAERSYDNQPYHLIELSNSSAEYGDVANHFVNYNIIKIERVQNPYQYGKYLVYKLQKNSTLEGIYLLPVKNDSDLDTALTFNCDYRQFNDIEFFRQVAYFNYPCKKWIISEELKSPDHIVKDSGRYPKYVVTLE